MSYTITAKSPVASARAKPKIAYKASECLVGLPVRRCPARAAVSWPNPPSQKIDIRRIISTLGRTTQLLSISSTHPIRKPR